MFPQYGCQHPLSPKGIGAAQIDEPEPFGQRYFCDIKMNVPNILYQIGLLNLKMTSTTCSKPCSRLEPNKNYSKIHLNF